MLRIATATTALLLLTFALPLAVAGDDEIRVVAYCDAGSCPGVSVGDRSDGCSWILDGYLGVCAYAEGIPPLSGGVGAGIWIGPGFQHGFCFEVRYCEGVSIESSSACATGKRLHYFSHNTGQSGDVCLPFKDLQW